jgi:FkbM family methyltransferase
MVKRLARLLAFIWHDESNRTERIHRLMAFFGWQLWKRTIARPLIVSLFNGYRFIAYPDCHVSSNLIYTRIPDYREISLLRQFLSGGTFVDVGANVGSVSLLLADKIEHALMFEPNPLAADRARENLAINHLGFDVYELALSDANGKIYFEDRGGVDTCNMTIASKSKTLFPTRVVVRVTFEQFLAERELEQANAFPPIQAIKIDVEGHENAVLKGRGCNVFGSPTTKFDNV